MSDSILDFKFLALENGRNISCRIDVGGRSYYDDRILKFDFDDITHPDWFTIGTACSNEFSFTVIHYDEPDIHECVRPYIQIGSSGWYPLGVFFIARRYFRGKYATFICYDRMYDLDVEFNHEFTPLTYTTAGEMLKYVCEEADIAFAGGCVEYDILVPEKSLTLRQLIGYIAALNCACAKMDRSGALKFISYSQMPTKKISAKNCFKITKNITRAGVGGLRVNTGTETLRYGTHKGLSLIDLYNPFMRQDIVYSIGKQLDPLYFYGAEIEMQGLPYLDSGEFILLDDTDGTLTPIVMSEIRYHYDGGLTAKLYSKNKSDSDTVVHRQEFDDALAELWEYVQNQNKTQ